MSVPFGDMLKELFTSAERESIRRTGMAIALQRPRQAKPKQQKRAPRRTRAQKDPGRSEEV